MDKFLIVWPKSHDVKHINYHYTQFGEIVDYLKQRVKGQIIAVDNDVEKCDIINLIKQEGISKVVLQVNYENITNSFKLAESIKKETKIPILAYGSIPVMYPNLFLNSSFDAIFRNGDPETCIKSFLENYSEDETEEQLSKKLIGTRIIKDGTFINSEPGKYILPDEWGISRKEDVPVEEYKKVKGKDRYVINISRGCPYDCPHCLIQLSEGRKERRRSIENLRESIEEIKDDYSHLKIWAANFTLDKEYVDRFCEMMKESFPGMTWECATRIDLVKDIKMLEKMHDAGCIQMSLGIEGLDNAHMIGTKDFNSFEISDAIGNLQRAGIQPKACIMLGMPNQTKADISSTLNFLKTRNVIIRPTIYTPYHRLPEDASLEEIETYNRRTFNNNMVRGVTSEQLIRLSKDPYNYSQILYGDKKPKDKNKNLT